MNTPARPLLRPTRSAIIARGRSAFTLMEILVVLVLLGLLAAMFVPQLQDILFKGRGAAAKNLQQQLTNWYAKWAPLGGAHGTGTSDQEAAQLAFNLMTKMTSSAGDLAAVGAGSTAVLAETTYLVINSSSIRDLISRPFSLGTGNVDGGTPGPYVIYDGQFLIRFHAGPATTASGSSNTGTWTVELQQ